MYEFIILAHLMRGPMHGYLIAKIINNMNGPYIRVSNGTIYPAFAKLEQQGLIAVETPLPTTQPSDRHNQPNAASGKCVPVCGLGRYECQFTRGVHAL